MMYAKKDHSTNSSTNIRFESENYYYNANSIKKKLEKKEEERKG